MSEPDLAAWSSPTAVVRALPFMAQLPPEVRNLILGGFEERTYRFGETVSTPADSAFVVVVEGEVRVIADGSDGSAVSLGVLGPGQTSGERALVEERPPGVTLRAASSAVRVLRLDRGVAVALARAHPEAAAAFSEQAHAQRIAAFLRTDDTFRDLHQKGVELIVSRGRPREAHEGDVIAREGECTTSWWIVESGRLVEHAGAEAARRDLRFLRAGDVFGEVGALDGSARLTTVTAVSDCRLLELDGPVLDALGRLDPEFASRLGDRARLHFSRIAVRPLDFGGGDVVSGVTQRPPMPPPSEDARMAAGVDVSEDLEAPAPWVAPRRFPFVRQIDFADCGVAALAMICRAFGRKVSLPFIRHIAGTGQEGTSLRGIMRAAEEAGLEGHAFKASKNRLGDLQLPAIIHWDGNHWVVLYAVESDRVRIADPGRGLRKYTRAEVEEKWSGWCASFRPTPRFQDAPVEHLDLAWVRPLVAPMRVTLAIATLMAIVATALQLLAPILTQRVVDAAAAGHSRRVSLLILLVVGLLFLGLGVGLLQRRMLARAAVRLDGDALDFVSGRLLQLPLKYFEARRTADIERRLNGLRQVRGLFVQGVVGGLSAVVQLVVTLFIMVSYSWIIALVFLATTPVYAGLMRYSSARLRPTFDSLEEAYSRHAAKQLDAIKGIEAAKSAGAEEGLRRGIQREFASLADRVFRSDWVLMFYDASVQSAGFLLFVLFLWVGALLVANGTLTIGQLVAVNSLVLLANAPIAILLGLWDQVQQATVLLQRLQDVLEAEPEQPAAQNGTTLRDVRRLSGRIALRRVALTYPDAPDRRILDDVSLVLEPGSTLGLVGRSGSGKSTLVRCLAGLVVPSNGSVLYDEVDMRELDWRQLRRRVGVVLQAPYLFDDTIAANIALGEDMPDMALVQRAAEIADAAGFIESMALGYDTKVGDSGMRLSGGQAQRVCIARALYHDPPVLLFDEATSALDTESEAAVKRNLDRVLEDRTAVIVAHRLTTIRDADVIAVLEQGRIVEHGSHDELLDRQGLYYHLQASHLG
jgi:ABC-type bacteriocin/lantibiotic exporter with double-glycine peptidase domain/CRP-like cAMP-binding protein